MNPRTAGAVAISLVAAGLLVNSGRRDGDHRRIARGRGSSLDRESLNNLIVDLPPRPRVAALQMLIQYGPPQEATSEHMIWHDIGPFKRFTVTRAEHHHDFPFPHICGASPV